MVTEMSRPIGAHDLTMQTGKLAKLADGAVVVTYGQTQVLATCVRSKPREGIDFFPLTIDVEERAYAAGKIPGSFFRREGRPGETAILTARLIDRPLRPTFKEGFRDEVQVVVTVLSVDMENPYDIWDGVWNNFAGKLEAAIVPDKQARDEAFGAVKEEAKAHLAETLGADALAERGQEFSAAWKSLQKKVMRRRVIEQGVRLDGRGAKDIRPLSAEAAVLPRAHGSALFERGETQVLNITTLGMLRMTQLIDTLDPEDSKRYMHHYNFPPFSTGETGRVGSPRRREIGHGALAERALI